MFICCTNQFLYTFHQTMVIALYRILYNFTKVCKLQNFYIQYLQNIHIQYEYCCIYTQQYQLLNNMNNIQYEYYNRIIIYKYEYLQNFHIQFLLTILLTCYHSLFTFGINRTISLKKTHQFFWVHAIQHHHFCF